MDSGLQRVCVQQILGEAMATGVMGEPMGNQTHTSKANQMQTQTKHVKAAASSLCNKYCKAHLDSFLFFKSNITTNVPNPVFSIQMREAVAIKQNTCSQSKKKKNKPFPISQPIKILFQFEQPIGTLHISKK